MRPQSGGGGGGGAICTTTCDPVEGLDEPRAGPPRPPRSLRGWLPSHLRIREACRVPARA
jgi:hypothetical protein